MSNENEITTNAANTKEVDNIKTTKNNIDDYKVIHDMMETMENHYKELRMTIDASIRKDYHVGKNGFEMLLYVKKHEIETMSFDDLTSFFVESESDEFKNGTDGIITYLTSTYAEDGKSDEDILRKCLFDIKDRYLQLMVIKSKCDEIKKEHDAIVNEYVTFMSSDKVRKAREEQLQKMLEVIETTEDPVERKKLEKITDLIRATLTISFIFDRIEVYGDSEIEAIKNAFFDKKKSEYIMKRYSVKARQFGYTQDSFKFFFNLEENFLPEEYHPFNNLFLFIYMRFIAFADPYNEKDLQYVHAITTNIAELVYHKFNKEEDESFIKEVIQRMDDQFKPYTDFFKTNNLTQSSHPARQEVSMKRKTEIRNAVTRKLQELGVTDYDVNASNEELQKLLTETQQRIIQEQVDEETKKI